MQIGELASTTGVTTKAIRYYESIGVLDEPARTDSGYRSYSNDAIERLNFVKQTQALGLALTEIRSILEIKDQGGRRVDTRVVCSADISTYSTARSSSFSERVSNSARCSNAPNRSTRPPAPTQTAAR